MESISTQSTEKVALVFEDFMKYFGKFALQVSGIVILMAALLYTPNDVLVYAIPAGLILAFGFWYAYARARIDKEYKDSMREYEERQKNIKPKRYGGAK